MSPDAANGDVTDEHEELRMNEPVSERNASPAAEDKSPPRRGDHGGEGGPIVRRAGAGAEVADAARSFRPRPEALAFFGRLHQIRTAHLAGERERATFLLDDLMGRLRESERRRGSGIEPAAEGGDVGRRADDPSR